MLTPVDIPGFCARFAVDPEHVVSTPAGVRLIGLPVAEADRVIVSMMAEGLIAWLDDPLLAEDEDLDGIEIVEDEADIIQAGGPAEAWLRMAGER